MLRDVLFSAFTYLLLIKSILTSNEIKVRKIIKIFLILAYKVDNSKTNFKNQSFPYLTTKDQLILSCFQSKELHFSMQSIF